jgi:Putative transmembrane protein (PGPGW)
MKTTVTFKGFRGLSFDTAQVKQASVPPIPEPPPSPPFESVEMPKSFREVMHRRYKSKTIMQLIKRIVVTVVGGTVLALGIALIVLPGPAFVVMPGGLAILAIEFAWARRWLRSARAILPLRSQGDPSPHRSPPAKSPVLNKNNGGKPRIEADSF